MAEYYSKYYPMNNEGGIALLKGAWDLTSSWEGEWKNEEDSLKEMRGKRDTGNYLSDKNDKPIYDVYYGTSYGLTANYLKNFAGWGGANKLALTPENVANLDRYEAGKIWKYTIWDNMIFGNNICDQDIANLLFDMVVHLQNLFIFKPKINSEKKLVSGYFVQWLSDKTKKPYTNFIKQKKYTDWGGNPFVKTDGFYVLTEEAIQELNSLSAANAKGIFDELKALRRKAEGNWSQNRQNAYNYGNCYSLQEFEGKQFIYDPRETVPIKGIFAESNNTMLLLAGLGLLYFISRK